MFWSRRLNWESERPVDPPRMSPRRLCKVPKLARLVSSEVWLTVACWIGMICWKAWA